MNLSAILGLFVVLIANGGALAQDLPIRPDDRLTPGVVASTDANDVCGIVDGLSYSRRNRHTSVELKHEIYAEYGINPEGRSFEVDHRVPLCIGGADVRENLWPQEGWQHPNFHDKDRLEEEVCRMVCRDHSMTLQTGQAIFLGDWIAGYRQVFGDDLSTGTDNTPKQ
jgi:hypothetical protein